MMEMMMMKMRITIALFLISARYNAGQTLTRKVGTEVTLHPRPPAGSEVIRSGEWAFTGASVSLLVVDWDAAGVTVYERFKDRCELNRTTGVLMIKALTWKDSGVYKAVINDKGADSTHVSVLSPVPKPTVSGSCHLTLTRCVLTCDGDTTHAEPVTYDWSSGDRASISSLKSLTITQEEHGDDGEFSCVVKNDVSEERSERIANPFKTTSQTLTRKVGTEVTLHPGPPAGSEVIRSGEWAFTGASGSLLVLDWDAAGVTVYQGFKDRCELNRTTGVLMIKALTLEDSGVYKAEINNKGAGSTHVSVLSAPVPKPTVSGSCHLAFTRCVLTCDGDTTHAEPVTYDWSSGDRASISSLKTLHITQEKHGDDGEFSCVVKNDVSEERSERIVNPFKRLNVLSFEIGFLVGFFVGVLVLLLVVAVAFFLCKCRTGWFGVPDKPENVVDVDNQVQPKVIDNELNGPQAPAERKTPENFPLLESPTGEPTGGPSGGPTGEPIRGPDAEDDPGNVDKSSDRERV
ncbi:cell adhesion molecule CEACAM2-like isoform X2 [Genypterus blacodes]|uniref:cell adhesion molecule CEACAM2-like isoform X2 n=1 Tax=Genypterus blacodes TaxID=154954 RepID=UPI003F767DBC